MISNIDKSEAIPMLFIPSVEQTAMKTLKKEYALYIHIPYCEKKCHFCSIPVTRFTDEMVLDRYVDALLYELKYKEEFLKKNTLIGIHIGGGTPSVLSVLQIKRLFDFITEMFGKELPEVVFEANPASLTKEKIDVLSQYYNVTLNLGVQTFNSQRLQEINRMNDVEAIKECLRYAMQKENLHVGIDLIVGLPNSKIIDFDNDIKIVRELGIKNIFIYSYRLEEKSFFYNYFDKKKCFLQNDMIRKMESGGIQSHTNTQSDRHLISDINCFNLVQNMKSLFFQSLKRTLAHDQEIFVLLKFLYKTIEIGKIFRNLPVNQSNQK